MFSTRRGVAASVALALAVTCTGPVAHPALAATTQSTITYHGGTHGTFENPEYETDQTKDRYVSEMSLKVDSGAEHTVADAPHKDSGASGTSAIKLDPQGGKFADGTDTALWTCIVSYIEDGCIEFTEWNTDEDGSGDSYDPGDKLTPATDVDLWAQWEESPKITHDALPSVTRDGYTFDGWYDKAEGGNLIGKAGDVPSTEWDHEGVECIYAHWTPVAAAAPAAKEESKPTLPGDLVQTGVIQDNLVPILLAAIVMGASAIAFLHLRRKL